MSPVFLEQILLKKAFSESSFSVVVDDIPLIVVKYIQINLSVVMMQLRRVSFLPVLALASALAIGRPYRLW